MSGEIKVHNGSVFNWKPIKVWNGSAWVVKPLKFWNGTAWELTNDTATISDIVYNLKYPLSGNYPSNDLQTWYFPNVNRGMWIEFSSFETEDRFDFLRIYEGTDDTGSLIMEYAGFVIPEKLWVESDLFLKFTSDSGNNYLGFEMKITDANYNVKDGDTINYPLNSINYKSNDTQIWLCKAVSGKQLKVSFTEFSTESGWDFLRIYEGTDDTGVLLATLTGTAIPSDISTTSGGDLFLKFNSDVSNNSTGFIFKIESF